MVERDTLGLPIEVVAPGGAVTTMTRDRYGNLAVFTDAAGAVTSFRYDARGLPVEETGPSGGRAVFEYDAHGNTIAVVHPHGAVWRASYDALGRRRAEVDALGAETRYAYSPRGDLITVTDALGGATRYAYDGEGHLAQIIDPKGSVTQMLWGGYHKLCIRKDANGHEVRLRYNLEGELVEVRNQRGELHRLEYDPAGRLIGETTFDGRRLGYRNDAVGRPIRVENGLGQKTKLTYDLAGQLVERELCDQSVDSFEYDPCGMLVGAVGMAGEVRFERDALGSIVREVQVVDGEEHSVEITYDGARRRVGRRTSLGHTEAFERSVAGDRTRSVLDGALAIEHTHDLLGREIARALPAGGRIESAFDPLGRLARRHALGPALHRPAGPGEPEWIGMRQDGVTAEKTYRYDLDGELIASWDTARGSTQYEYDPVGQLLSMVPDKARSEVFRYDPTGNIHEAGEGAGSREYGAGSRLLRKGGTEYRWDEDGRLAEKRVHDPESGQALLWKYTWDPTGLLGSATAPDGTLVELTYDPFARRVQKRVSRPMTPGATPTLVSSTRFVWDGDVLVHEIKTAARAGGDPVVDERTYLFSEETFEPLAHQDVKRDDVGRTGGRWFHYVNDPIGTPERLVGPNGSIACELGRTAWGKTEVAPGATTSTPIRFQGQYEDEETGLCYNRFRYYDPEAGRFISSDPIGLSGGINSHAYALNPIADTDPMGLARRPRNAQQELRAVGSLSGRPRADIERDLQSRGFRSCSGRAGGTVWTKPMPRGQTAAVRLDPAVQRNPPSGFADEVPHAHKEIVPTSAVNRRGNYDGQATTLDDAGNRTNDRRATHIPIT